MPAMPIAESRPPMAGRHRVHTYIGSVGKGISVIFRETETGGMGRSWTRADDRDSDTLRIGGAINTGVFRFGAGRTGIESR
jgi:hypothetical protein